MRFLFLTVGYHPDVIGGAWRYAAEVAERLAARGHTVEVICQDAERPVPATETRRGVRLHRFSKASGPFFIKWRRENAAATATAKQLLSQAGGAVLVCAHHAYLEPALRSCVGAKVFMFHGPWAEEFRSAQRARPGNLAQRWLNAVIVTRLRATERRALRSVERIFVVSRHFQEQLARWHPGGLPPVKPISAGTDTNHFQPVADRPEVRKTCGLNPDDFLFLALRRLDPRMGLVTLLDAFGRSAARYPRARLWLTGRGPMEAELRRRINEAGLKGRVRLLGFVPEPELPRLLSAADCTVMPSLDLEGFGLATVESLACGTPVLGSRAGATPELLLPLSPQLLFEANSVDSLADKLQEVLARPACLPDRPSCRAYVLKNYTWDRPVTAFEECHAQVCSAGGKR
jgi:glycosyltransferase involved in cell wall biosynthesis